MGRIARGFHLLGVSWDVLRADKQLMLLPVCSFACFFVVIGVMTGAVFQAGLLHVGAQPTAAHYVALAIFYFVAYFIGIFFNAAVVACAMIRLDGGRPTLRDGLRMAFTKIDKILGWAIIAATVGVVLRALEERAGAFGRIVINVVGAVWAALTFFVVPVILFEPETVGGSIKRSTRLFRERWGEYLVGNGSIGIAMFLILLPVMFFVFGIIMVNPIVGIVIAFLVFGFMIAAGSAMTGIFNAALYRFAVTGSAVGGFSEGDLRAAFAPRPGRFGRTRTTMPRASEHFAELLARHEELKRQQATPEPGGHARDNDDDDGQRYEPPPQDPLF